MTRPVASLAGRRAYLDANVFIYALNGFPSLVDVLGGIFGLLDQNLMTAVTSELTLAELLVKPHRR
jgi:predicted nucleic acid-binding protein